VAVESKLCDRVENCDIRRQSAVPRFGDALGGDPFPLGGEPSSADDLRISVDTWQEHARRVRGLRP